MIIRKMEYSDAVAVSNMIKTSSSISNGVLVIKDVLSHIDSPDSLAVVLVDGDAIVGIWCSKEFEDYISLSFFYIEESTRRRMIVLQFFKECLDNINTSKPVLIKSADITGFDRYVKHIEDDVYQFMGFRQWEE